MVSENYNIYFIQQTIFYLPKSKSLPTDRFCLINLLELANNQLCAINLLDRASPTTSSFFFWLADPKIFSYYHPPKSFLIFYSINKFFLQFSFSKLRGFWSIIKLQVFLYYFSFRFEGFLSSLFIFWVFFLSFNWVERFFILMLHSQTFIFSEVCF